MKLFSALVLFIISWSLITLAQVPAPSPTAVVAAVVAAPAAQGGFWGWIMAHGGLQAAVLLLVACFNIIISAVRDLLCKLDGIDLSQPIPADKTKLTFINKVALVSGKVLDWASANVQHK